MTLEQKKQWYTEVVFPLCFTDGEGYWGRMFREKRDWQPEHAAGLIFALTAAPGTLKFDLQGRVEGGDVVPVAQIPSPWPFWDCILSAMVLFHPECWPDERVLAKHIYARLQKWGYQCPQQYLNFDGNHLKRLDALLDGTQRLTFLDNPLMFTCALEAFKIPFLREHHELPAKPVTDSISEMARYMQERKRVSSAQRTFKDILFEMAETIATRWEEMFGPITIEAETS